MTATWDPFWNATKSFENNYMGIFFFYGDAWSINQHSSPSQITFMIFFICPQTLVIIMSESPELDAPVGRLLPSGAFPLIPGGRRRGW